MTPNIKFQVGDIVRIPSHNDGKSYVVIERGGNDIGHCVLGGHGGPSFIAAESALELDSSFVEKRRIQSTDNQALWDALEGIKQ